MTTKTLSTTAKAALLGVLLSGVASSAFAQDANQARIAALEAQVQALADQIADLKTQSSAAVADIRTIATTTPVTIAGGKPVIASADGGFSIGLHGVFQLDSAVYDQKSGLPATVVGPDLNSGTNFRRARIGVDGKFNSNFDYYLLFDFGGSGTDSGGAGTSGAALHEGWIQYDGYKLAGKYATRLRIGAFAPSLGLEDAKSTNGSLFVERASPAEIARSIAGADKRIGAQFGANGDHWLTAVAVTGAKTGDLATFDEQLAVTGRVAGTPLFGPDYRLHIGANASYVLRPAQTTSLLPNTAVTLSDRPELRVDGTQLITTGAFDASHVSHYGGELGFQKKGLTVEAEAFRYDIERRVPGALTNPHFSGWYVQAGWVLTGEMRKYNTINGAFDAPAVAKPLSADGGWGAWEVAVRYSDTNLNYNSGLSGVATPVGGVRGGEQKIWTAGLNWFPNADVKLALQLENVDVHRLTAAGAQAGQRFNALNLRSQFSF